MADQPLSSATYHHLGRPLPYQLVNTPRVHLKAIAETIFYIMTMRSSWLCGISTCFQVLSPSFRQVTHVLLTRSPLTVLTVMQASVSNLFVRLACIRHAASVRPEPGSNSQFKVCDSLIFTSELTSQMLFDLLIASTLHIWFV